MNQSRSKGKVQRQPTPHYTPNLSNQGDFIFNRTSILTTALRKLKKEPSAKLKRPIEHAPEQSLEKPSKKIKQTNEGLTLSYTPLQKDLYNFYTINKTTIRGFQQVPEPRLEVGSSILAAICDRGIGGKYLVANLFRNKKAYIDYTDIPLEARNQKAALESLELYEEPGDFVAGAVIKARNPGKIQLSFNAVEPINQKNLRIGQVLLAQVTSKEQMGCHLKVRGGKKHKYFLPKGYVSDNSFQGFKQKKLVLVVVKQHDPLKRLTKVALAIESQTAINLWGVGQQELGRLQLQQYVFPGTLINTKVVSVLSNGLLVKFLKIFMGFIHADHLQLPLTQYKQDQKILGRVIFSCVNPPTVYLSERHRKLKTYQPTHELFASRNKPTQLRQIQGAFLNTQEQFFVHPVQLHSQIGSLKRFWAKENNYFEGYQVMTSRKVGLRVGEIAKGIPFSNFKVFGEGSQSKGKFRVMCLDLWNKVIKVAYDNKVIQAQNLLIDADNADPNQKYCGFISNVNQNGAVVQFCNNLKGILAKRQLEINGQDITEANIGEGIEVYVVNKKKNYLGLTLAPPAARRNKDKELQASSIKEQIGFGIIQSVHAGSIHPIYVKLKQKLVKINVFEGIRPAGLEQLPFIRDLASNFQVGERVKVFQKGGKYYLYPPQQLQDPALRFCRIVAINDNNLRVQVGKQDFRTCHISDVTDLLSPYPLNQYKIGEYTIARLADEKYVSLRHSFVQHGIPKSMQEVLKNFGEDEKRGDLRARIEAVGPAGLKLDSLAFGYVKSCGQKGCFVSLGRNFEVRVDGSELSDQFISNKSDAFKTNRLVLLRLIGSKTKGQNQVLWDASLRESVVKHGYPLNDQILEVGVGLTVEGQVTGYVKGKALVRLDCSRFTGIISLKDVEGAGELTLQKALPIGKHLICKVVEYSREGEKRLIRLSTLAKSFNKYKGLETQFDSDPRVISLWENYVKLAAVQPPIQEEQKILPEDNEEEQYARLKKLLAENHMEIENRNEEQQQSQYLEHQNQQKQVEEMDNQGQNDRSDEQGEEQLDEQQNEQQEQQHEQQKRRASNKKETVQMQRIAGQFQKMPQSREFYQSLLLANPTPESHLLYISSLLPTSSPDEVRTQFVRAINSLSDIKDKDNMWISWINTQIILGDLAGTVRKAVQSNVGPSVYFRVLEILAEQANWVVAFEFARKMLKKFNREPKAYSAVLKLETQCILAGETVPETLSTKELLRRASQCLKSNEVLQIESHLGRSLFELGEPERGRNVLEQLVTRYPKRTDIWSVYVDQEIKQGGIGRARNLLERALALRLKKKAAIGLLKKYLQVQKVHGDAEGVSRVLERAKAAAAEYEVEKEDQSGDEN